MLKEKLSQALSDQVNAELYSAYLYLAMSAHSDRAGFKGFANWLDIQAQEEMAHAMHMFSHILERGATPSFQAVEAPPAEFDSLTSLFEKVLSHEQYVSQRIDKIATLAMQESDHATYGFIQWYVNEQVEEESSADEILQKLKYIGDNLSMLYTLDTELGTRVFIDPFAGTAG